MSVFTTFANSAQKGANNFSNALAGLGSGALAGSSGGWIGSAIGAAAGLGTALLSNYQAKKNRQANEVLAEKQFQQNKEMWDLQNQYNSPLMQTNRLKNAGLSPALAYGGNGQLVGNADSTPQLDYAGAMATPAFDYNSAIQQGLSARQLVSQIGLNDSSSTKNRVEAIRYASLLPEEKRQIQQSILLDEAKTAESYQKIEESQATVNLIAENINMTKEQTRGLQLYNDICEASKDDQIAYYEIRNRHEEANIREINKKMEVYKAQIDEIKSQIHVNESVYANNMASARLADASRDNVQADTGRIEAYTTVLGKQSEQLDYLIKTAAAEQKIAEKDARWYVYKQISSDVIDVAKVGVQAYTGYSFANAAQTNASTAANRADTYRHQVSVNTGYKGYGPLKPLK